MVLRLKARYTQLITPLLNGNSSRSSSSNQMHKRDHEYNTRQSHRPTTITTVRPRLASDLDVAVSLGATSSYQGRANRPKKVLAIKVKNEGRRTNVIASDSSDNLVPISQRTAPKNTKSQSPDIPLNDSPTLSGDRTCRIRRSAASRPVKYTEESSDEEFSPVVPEVQTDENVDDENFNGESSSEEDEDEDEDEEKLLKTRKNRPQPEVKEAPRARVKRHLESSEEEDEEEEENMRFTASNLC